MSSLFSWVGKLGLKIKSIFSRTEKSGKKVIRNDVFKLLAYTFALFAILVLMFGLQDEESENYAGSEDAPGTEEVHDLENLPISQFDEFKQHIDDGEDSKKQKKKVSITRSKPIQYKANQIITRSEENNHQLTGDARLVAKLNQKIDTRRLPSEVSAALLYPVKMKEMTLEKGSIFFGIPSHSIEEEKVFIEFNKVKLPGGRKFPILAKALDPRNFSLGMSAKYHGTLGKRLGVGALGFLSGVAEGLQEYEALGEGLIVTKKANTRNALISGGSNLLQGEIQHQAQRVNEIEPYLTLQSGEPLIIQIQ